MSQERKSPITLTAGAALEAFTRVKLSADNTVINAGAGEEFIGTTIEKVASGELVGIKLRSSLETTKCVAAGAVTLNATIYGAANGKIDDAASGTAQGVALEAATADGDVIEILFNTGAAGNIGGGALVNQETDNGAVPIVIQKSCAFNATPDPIDVITAGRKLRILDWHLISKDTTAANITVKNDGTSICTAVLAKGTTNDAIVRAATLVAAQQVVTAGKKITVETSAQCTIELVIIAIPIA